MKLYSSPSSLIEYSENKSLIVATWKKQAAQLTESETKQEILKVLEFTRKHAAKKIIIDATHYPFRENYELQKWINFTFMPQVIEAKVLKYAIITDIPIVDRYENFDDLDTENLSVEYFKNLDEALEWME
jgi:hypothetical protein